LESMVLTQMKLRMEMHLPTTHFKAWQGWCPHCCSILGTAALHQTSQSSFS
jgi:hypothetical protein